MPADFRTRGLSQMKIPVTIEVEAPDGATHYTGDILDDPIWWKHQVNSTGAIKAWYFNHGYGGPWYYHGEREPHFLQAIK